MAVLRCSNSASMPLWVGSKMLNNDKAEAASFGHMLDKLFQCLQSAGGSSQPDDGKGITAASLDIG